VHDAELVDALAEDVLRRPAEQAFRRRVPRGHPEVGAPLHDGEGRLLGVEPQPLERVGESPLRLLVRGDVDVDDHGADDGALLRADRDPGVQDRLPRAVEALDVDHLVEAGLALQRTRQRPFLGGDARAGVGPPPLVLSILGHADVAGAAPHPLTGRIAEDDPTGLIGEPDADRQRLQHRAEPMLALEQRRPLALQLGDAGLERGETFSFLIAQPSPRRVRRGPCRGARLPTL
jgi:hypothetical protein